MKAKIVQGGIGTYEVWVQTAWYMPYRPIYNGMFPFRGTLSQAKQLIDKVKK